MEFYDKLIVTVPDGISEDALAQMRRRAQDAYLDALGLEFTDDVIVHSHDPVTGDSHDETVAAAKARRSNR